MKKTFQSFVFGCRVNEAERIKLDKELVEAGYTVDLSTPSFLIINTCAITGKAEREAKQLIYQLKKQHPEAKIILTGCSATLWKKYDAAEAKLVDLIVTNDQKSRLISLLHTSGVCTAAAAGTEAPSRAPQPQIDKFRYSNRLLVKIQDGCHRFCSYCIVPYLRGLPQSQKIADIIAYILSFTPPPSEVILSAINTEAFGKDSNESFVDLIKLALKQTVVPRIGFGSVHPWSLSDEFMTYYQDFLSQERRFIQFFHVPIQSGSQTMLGYMRREYHLEDILVQLKRISRLQPHALLATDIIVGYLGETDELFEETFQTLKRSPISRFHVFRFSNRPHTAAYYQKKHLFEPTADQKKIRSERLIALSKAKYTSFLETLVGHAFDALIIAESRGGLKISLNNQVEGFIPKKNGLPGQILHVTIIAAKESVVIAKES